MDDAHRSQRVLCIGLAEMGSIVLAAPALEQLRQRGWNVHFLTFARHRDVPALAGITDEANIHCLRTDTVWQLGADVLAFVFRMQQLKPMAVIDLEPCMYFSALLAVASGAPLRAGFTHAGTPWHTRNGLYDPAVAYRSDRHMTENFLMLADTLTAKRVLRGVGLGHPSSPKRSHRASEVVPRLAKYFPGLVLAAHRLIFLNSNAGDAIPQRRWDGDSFAELGRRILARYPDTLIVLIGAAEERDAVEAIAQQLPAGRCANLAGAFGLAELPTLLSQGALLISNDSGPAHLATLTDLPVVVLFGPETPRLYAPRGNTVAIYAGLPCSPCITPQNFRATDCSDNRCMRAITVERVMDAVERQLVARLSGHRVLAA